FEVDYGTFNHTVDYQINKFSEFPAAVTLNKNRFSGHSIVTFCTGGIRCEKAALYMRQVGLDNVYQLDGGILKYFEEVGDAHYKGRCFVFDERVTLDARLREVPEEGAR